MTITIHSHNYNGNTLTFTATIPDFAIFTSAQVMVANIPRATWSSIAPHSQPFNIPVTVNYSSTVNPYVWSIIIKDNATGAILDQVTTSTPHTTGTGQLATPANPSIQSNTGTSLTLSFPAVPNATNYSAIYYNTAITPIVSSQIDFTGGGGTTIGFTLSGLLSSTTYNIKVIAKATGYITSNPSSVNVTTVAVVLPRTPTPIINQPVLSANTVALSWSATPTNSYQASLIRSSDSLVIGTSLVSGTSKTYTGLGSGNAYQFLLVAKGNGTTTSDSLTATVSFVIPGTVTQLPAPTGLTLVASTSSSIQYSFNPVANATSYVTQWRESALPSPYVWSQQDHTFAGFTVTGLKPSTSYVIAVQAKAVGYTSSGFTQNSFSTVAVTVPTLAIPTGMALISKSDNSIRIGFTAVPNATSYSSQINDIAIIPKVTSQKDHTATQIEFTGLTANHTYQIATQAKATGYTSSLFATIQITTANVIDPPPDPTGSGSGLGEFGKILGVLFAGAMILPSKRSRK